MERFLNTNPPVQQRDQVLRSRKERLNAQSHHSAGPGGGSELLTRAIVHSEPVHTESTVADETELRDTASGFQTFGTARQQVFCAHSAADSKPHGRQQAISPHSFQYNVCNDIEPRSTRLLNETDSRSAGTRLVNDCEAPRGANKRPPSLDSTPGSERKTVVNMRNHNETPGRDFKPCQLNTYQTETVSETNTNTNTNIEAETSMRSSNQCNQFTPRARRNLHVMSDNVTVGVQHNCIGDGYCLMASEKGVRRKNNKGNNAVECKAEINSSRGQTQDSLEECVYSEVAALISSNEWRPQFLLQLFKDLRLLSSCADPNTQAALSSIHVLATKTAQEERNGVNEEVPSNQTGLPTPQPLNNPSENCQQPRNWSHKDITPQLPSNCAKLDFEVRNILVEMLPFIKSQLGELCGPLLLEALRKLILHLVPSQPTQEQLDAQLEDALHKFQGCRLGDVYEELLTVVADVLISELTFLRLINTVNHSADQPNSEEAAKEGEEEEGAVGGVVEETEPPSLLAVHPANQTRRTKSENVSEADLAEADQSRHTNTLEVEERGETAEGIDISEEGAVGQCVSVDCNGTTSEFELNWTPEQDREMGLDQVPTRLHNPTETQPDSLVQSLASNSSTPPDPGPI